MTHEEAIAHINSMQRVAENGGDGELVRISRPAVRGWFEATQVMVNDSRNLIGLAFAVADHLGIPHEDLEFMGVEDLIARLNA